MKKPNTFKSEPQEHTERCVQCGRDTAYSVQTPIEQRHGYVEGSSQLCDDCYKELYPKGSVSYG